MDPALDDPVVVGTTIALTASPSNVPFASNDPLDREIGAFKYKPML
jgi:hypothetical protein